MMTDKIDEVLGKQVFESRSIIDVPEVDGLRDILNVSSNLDAYAELGESNPSDMVVMTFPLLTRFIDMISEFGLNNTYGVPRDILIDGTVPIKDVVFCFGEADNPVHVRMLVDGDRLTMVYDPRLSTVFAFHTAAADDYERLSVSNVYSNDVELARRYFEQTNLTGFVILLDQILKFWYIFQICLLNPPIKERLLKKRGKEKLGGSCLTEKKNGRKARYVRYYQVEEDIFEFETATDERGFERRTLSWYVIGHWRNYASGKKSFVHGYWKGPMREAKRNLDKGRERVL